MAHFVQISDPDDPRLGDYRRLRDVQLRTLQETEQGLFIAEGEKIIRRAFDAGYVPRSVLLAPRWIDGLREYLDRWDTPVYIVEEKLAEAITGFHVHRGALASMFRSQRHTMAGLLAGRRLVVCEDIVDHTNVGAIIRCAAGLGWDGVLLAPRAADPLYRRAIKTSMGASLTMPWARMTDWAGDLLRLREAGFHLAAMALGPGARPIDEFADGVRHQDTRLALLMGTEGAGLSGRWLAQADTILTIPMSRGIDSLNVAAATAIACHLLR